jgi:hypothetical protein
LLDQDMQRVLLVKGWKNTACWGFPRGKIHKNETDAQCAVREVRMTALATAWRLALISMMVAMWWCAGQSGLPKR